MLLVSACAKTDFGERPGRMGFKFLRAGGDVEAGFLPNTCRDSGKRGNPGYFLDSCLIHAGIQVNGASGIHGFIATKTLRNQGYFRLR